MDDRDASMAASIAGKTSSPVRNHWQAVWVGTDDIPDTIFCGGKNGNGGNAWKCNGGFWGVALAIVLPLTRFCFHFTWDNPLSLWDAALNATIRTVVLVGAPILIDRVRRQTQEIRTLRGILPICSFCKQIRTPDEQWHSVEAYITEHSEAKFTHAYCPEYIRKHYGDSSAGEDAPTNPPDILMPPR